MKIYALILAKEKSKRLPGKNLKDFKGKPMFLVNVEKCLRIFDKVYVSSDSPEILDIARKNGALPILRGKDLVGETPDIQVYQHAIGFMKDCDVVVAVHANNPTIETNLIAMSKKVMEMGVQELMTCYPMTHGDDYHKQSNKIYGSIRGLTRERILSYPDAYKPNPDVLLVDNSIEIEYLEDYNRALCQ